ncbi:Sugar transporter ERD6-like 15, partial [Armadillidium vulgare]
IISAVSLTIVGYSGGVVLAYPGILISQLSMQNPELSLSTSNASWFGYAVYFPLLLIIIRAIQGFINAFLGPLTYIYPCEIADKKRRGMLGAVADSSFSLGFLVTYLVGGVVKWSYFSYIIIGITILPCFIGVYFVPESPVWLARHGKMTKARNVLSTIRKTDEIECELFAYEERARNENSMKLTIFQRIKLLGKGSNFFPVSAALLMLTLKETTGQFAVTLFIFEIIKKSNPSLSVYWCSAIVGLTRFISNLFSVILLTKIPRRHLIAIPALIETLSLFGLGFYFYYEPWHNSPDLLYLPVVLLVISVICYGVGIGPTSWVLATEILPSAVRSIGSGLSQAGFFLMQWLVAGSFSIIETSLGLHVCFFTYSVRMFFHGRFCFVVSPRNKRQNSDRNRRFLVLFGRTSDENEKEIHLEKLQPQRGRNKITDK